MTSRRFLLMINSWSCPNGIGRPRSSKDWNGGEFVCSKPRKSKKGKKLPEYQYRNPEPGDQILIWVNEKGGGFGLTGMGQVSRCFPKYDGNQLILTVDGVELFSNRDFNNDKLEEEKNYSETANDIRSSTVHTLRYLLDDDWEYLLYMAHVEDIDHFEGYNFDSISEQDFSNAVMKQRQDRDGQADFREQVFQAYEGECAVTGCNVSEALEAAHIIPYRLIRGNSMRVCNGLLLRADIHALFDRQRLGFVVKRDAIQVELSPNIRDSEYAEYEGKIIKIPQHPRDRPCLFALRERSQKFRILQ